MKQIAVPITAAFLAFGGLLLGGTVGVFAKQIIEEKKYLLYAFCGGILMGLLFLELVPETFASYHPTGPALGLVFGLLLMYILDTYFHSSAENRGQPQASQAFLFLSLAICIHNIPTGIAIGSSVSANEAAAASLLLAVIFHHIPEGLALVIPFSFTRFKLSAFICTIFLLSFVLGAGTFIGSSIPFRTNHLQGIIMGSAIGTISYVALHEMLWKAMQKVRFFPFISYTLAGMIIVRLYIEIFMHHH